MGIAKAAAIMKNALSLPFFRIFMFLRMLSVGFRLVAHAKIAVFAQNPRIPAFLQCKKASFCLKNGLFSNYERYNFGG